MKQEKGRKKEYSNVKIIKESKSDLDAIAKSFGLKVGEVMEAMIAYFKHTKQSPINQKKQMNELEGFKEEIQEGVIARSREMVETFLKKQKEEHFKALNEVLEKVEAKERIFSNDKALELWNTFKKELPLSLQSLDKYQKAFETLGKKVEKPSDPFLYMLKDK
ncbi:hypothetical protein AD998_21380 [bacterium 336/3]|nr:hypothetical protein AD998_21380 [bacterium 336/3]